MPTSAIGVLPCESPQGLTHTAGQAPVELCIWGLGLIGFTLACEFARVGRRCLVVDISAERVARCNSGAVPFTHVPHVGTAYAAEIASRLVRATTKPSEAITAEHEVHILCVPTECAGEIDASALCEVVEAIATAADAARPLYLVVESTIAPTWVDSIIHSTFVSNGWRHGFDYHLCVSPRRDWLAFDGRTLSTIPKIVGGDSIEGVGMTLALYRDICGQMLVARDAKHAALVKVLENLFRYRAILLATELAAMFTEYDIAAALRLAATKWNMGDYHPSLGIGGYCVPLAKDYLAEGTDRGDWLARLDRAEARLADWVQRAVAKQGLFRRVGILGLAYAPDMKISTRSPTVDLTRFLKLQGREVRVNDPLYVDEEIVELTGARPLRFPEGLSECDSVVLVTGHKSYRDVDHGLLLEYCRHEVTIVDNLGVWIDRQFPANVRYVEVGGAGFGELVGDDSVGGGDWP